MPQYEEFDTRGAAAFAAASLGGDVRSATEIGDGNLNRVFRIESTEGSVVVKQALPYLKVAGEDWPLTRRRATIEHDAIGVHAELAPGLLPAVIHFDEDQSAMVLEDLRDHESWREALIAGRPTPGVAARVGQYSAAVLLGTGQLTSEQRRRDLRRRFGYSDLCLLTEELVFVGPYTASESNRFDPELAATVAELARDRALGSMSGQLRYIFRTRNEALIHGDLHTGSVFVGPGGPKVIDQEFAFFGPVGFDVGLLVANLAISSLAHASAGREEFASLVRSYAFEYWQSFARECHGLWKSGEPWFHRFLAGVLDDAARFAGLEMIRRTMGLAHARDLDALDQPARLEAQVNSIDGGRSLLVGVACSTFDELWARATSSDRLG